MPAPRCGDTPWRGLDCSSTTRGPPDVKLADNLWVDLNVALANEMAKVCDRLGMDALQVIDAANTMPRAAATSTSCGRAWASAATA